MAARPYSTFVVSITPFRADGALDEVGLRGHLARRRDAGVGVYLAGSGSGEGYTLTPDETRRVLEIGVEVLGGHAPVRAMGVEPRTASDAVALGTRRGGRRRRRLPALLARPGAREPAHPGRARPVRALRPRRGRAAGRPLHPPERRLPPAGRAPRVDPGRRRPGDRRELLDGRRHLPAPRRRGGGRAGRRARRRPAARPHRPGPRRAGLPQLRRQPRPPTLRVPRRGGAPRRPHRAARRVRRAHAALHGHPRARRDHGDEGRAGPARPPGRRAATTAPVPGRHADTATRSNAGSSTRWPGPRARGCGEPPPRRGASRAASSRRRTTSRPRPASPSWPRAATRWTR